MNELTIDEILAQAPAGANSFPEEADSRGNLIDNILAGSPGGQPEPIGVGQGLKNLGQGLIGSVGAAATNLYRDIHRTAFMPVRNLSDFETLAGQTIEEATRPAREVIRGALRVPVEAISTPILSGAQYITGKKEEFSLPFLGKFDSFQEQAKNLRPVVGRSLSIGIPVGTYLLDLLALGGETKSLKGYLAHATEPAPAVVRFLGPEAKNVPDNVLGTWNQMTKYQAAEEALARENPDLVNIQKMIQSGAEPNQAQESALKAIVERAEKITPEEHLNMIYKIAKNIGETPEEISKSLPNYLKKYSLFESLAPEISARAGVAPEQLTLLRNDTLTNVDIDEIIKDVKKMKWSEFSVTNPQAEVDSYRNAIGRIYDKYPGLKNFQAVLEPDVTNFSGGGIKGIAHELKDLGLGQLAPGGSYEPLQSQLLSPLKGRIDLIDRLNILKTIVNREIPIEGLGSQKLTDAVNEIGLAEPRGYKIGFSPLNYTPIIPKTEAPLPTQNWLGKLTDNLGLRGIDQRQLNWAWQNKFQRLFNDEFENGIVSKNGATLDTGILQPVFSKAGVSYQPKGKGNILDLLYNLKESSNKISVTELSFKDLKTVFSPSDASNLEQIIRESRVLPVSLEGMGVNVVNRLRTNPFFDDFYRATMAGHFTYGPGFGVRHAFKNQILGAFEGKPLNLGGFADTDAGQLLINKFPTIFGGSSPSAEELGSLQKLMGRTALNLDPASEAWIYNHMDLNIADAAIKESIKSPNWIERMMGYTQTQDVVDLARSFARRNGTTISDIVKEGGPLSKKLQNVITTTYSYGPGILTSPAIKTLNTVLYPIRFDAKVMLNTARWFVKQPILVRSALVGDFNEALRNVNTQDARRFLRDNQTMTRAITYLVPYTNFLNIFGDVVQTIGDFTTPSRIPGDLFKTFEDNFYVGGLMFGLLNKTAQDQGLIPKTQYINFKGQVQPQFIPRGYGARAKIFLRDFINHIWPNGLEILGTINPSGLGRAVNFLPQNAKFLPAGQKRRAHVIH